MEGAQQRGKPSRANESGQPEGMKSKQPAGRAIDSAQAKQRDGQAKGTSC